MGTGIFVAGVTAITLSFLVSALGCPRDRAPPPPAAADTRGDAVLALMGEENARRDALDFTGQPPYARVSGANPVAFAADAANRFVALAGRHEVVALIADEAGRIRAGRAVALPAAESLCITRGFLYVVGRSAPVLSQVAVRDAAAAEGLAPAVMTLHVPSWISPRGIACRGDDLFVIDEDAHTLTRLTHRDGGLPERRATVPAGRWPAHVVAPKGSDLVFVGTVLSHEVIAWRAGPTPLREVARHQRRAPIFSLTARRHGAGHDVVVGTLEERDLDRTRGFFAHIDSALARLRLDDKAAVFTLGNAVNLSEAGLITPSALTWRGADVVVHGRGSRGALVANATGTLTPEDAPFSVDAAFETGALRCTASALTNRVVCDNRAGGTAVRSVIDFARPDDDAQRIGEALFFTGLMAPNATAAGDHSRFSCETCHFEGYFDGRIHFTGRDDVHATSKPLRGLWNNRPHFSRAMDANVAVMVDAEFNVANAGDKTAAWFGVPADDPALTDLDIGRAQSPVNLRRALMTFLRAFTFEAHPHTRGRAHYDALERRGEALFARRCERCHQARSVADDPRTRRPQSDWEAQLFAPEGNTLVFARDGYEKTGVTPYVHKSGVRPPSLRRVYKKWPYFTNGSASSLRDVLDAVRIGAPPGDAPDAPAPFWHRAPDDDAPAVASPLSREERTALEAFLRLL